MIILNTSKLCIIIQVYVVRWQCSGFTVLAINEFSRNLLVTQLSRKRGYATLQHGFHVSL